MIVSLPVKGQSHQAQLTKR